MGSQENFTNFKTGLDQKVANSEDAADAMDEQIAKINADIDGLEYACDQAAILVRDTAMASTNTTMIPNWFWPPYEASSTYWHTFRDFFSGHIDLISTVDSTSNLSDWQTHSLIVDKNTAPNQNYKFYAGPPTDYSTMPSMGQCYVDFPMIPANPEGDPPTQEIPAHRDWVGQAQFYIQGPVIDPTPTLVNIYHAFYETLNNPNSMPNQRNWLAVQQGSDSTSISLVSVVCTSFGYCNNGANYCVVLCVDSTGSETTHPAKTATFNRDTATKISRIGYSYYNNTRPIQGNFSGTSPYVPGDPGISWTIDSTSDSTITKQVSGDGIYRYCLNYCWAPISLDGTYGLVAQRDNINIGKAVNQKNQDNDKEGQTQLGDIT